MKNIIDLKKNNFFVGRAATGIYLILKSMNVTRKKVLAPANICYAAIYPIIYSDNIPSFMDVEENSGNISIEILEKKYEEESDIVAVIAPHMYGNPIQDIESIRLFCNKHDIILIEDCASAMGTFVEGVQTGTFGDYVLYSTGYAKTIDLGLGGIVSSDRDMSCFNKYYEELPFYNEQVEANEAFYSKLYRLIRNDRSQNISKYIFAGMKNNLQDLFLFQLEPSVIIEMKKRICKLEEQIVIRRDNTQIYNSLINDNSNITKYEMYDGSVAWRYNLLIAPEQKTPFIKYLLTNNVPVSDWYPCVTEIFGDDGIYCNTTKMEQQIINFPLIIEQSEIERICMLINNYFINL